jgi:hypothetical protein
LLEEDMALARMMVAAPTASDSLCRALVALTAARGRALALVLRCVDDTLATDAARTLLAGEAHTA